MKNIVCWHTEDRTHRKRGKVLASCVGSNRAETFCLSMFSFLGVPSGKLAGVRYGPPTCKNKKIKQNKETRSTLGFGAPRIEQI